MYNGLWQIAENKASPYRDIRRVSVSLRYVVKGSAVLTNQARLSPKKSSTIHPEASVTYAADRDTDATVRSSIFIARGQLLLGIDTGW